jgi:hypothetical protein
MSAKFFVKDKKYANEIKRQTDFEEKSRFGGYLTNRITMVKPFIFLRQY